MKINNQIAEEIRRQLYNQIFETCGGMFPFRFHRYLGKLSKWLGILDYLVIEIKPIK